MTDKDIYEIIYNPATDELQGDLQITLTGNASYSPLIELYPHTSQLSLLQTGSNTYNIVKGADFDNVKTDLSAGTSIMYTGRMGQNVSGIFQQETEFTIFLEQKNGVPNPPLSSSPSSLAFIVSKDLGETKTEIITITGDIQNVSMTGPDWLMLTPLGTNKVEVTTHNSATLPIGTHTGNITFTRANQVVYISVSLTVIAIEMINELGEYNFCLDAKKIYFKQYHPNLKYKRVKINGTQYISNEEHHIQQIYDLVYFNGETNIDIGEKVQQFIEPFKDILLDMALKKHVMKPISIQIDIADLNDKFEELHQKNLGTFYFYPGKKPKAYPLLTNHRIRKRVNLSKMLISYIEGVAVPNTWGILKSINDGAAYDISCLILTEFNLNFPKVFNFGTMKVISFPTPQNAFHIQWLNQNLVPEWATFTGEFKIKTAYHHTISKSVFTNKKKKYDSEKEKSLSINTGFILKAEIPMIEEMMSSSIVYIEMDNRLLKCIPNGEKLDSEDSTTQLVTFELEFLIISEIWK